MQINAEKPKTSGGLQYHTHTGLNDLAAFCLIVGAPGRVYLIAKLLTDVKMFFNDHRGLVSCTGKYHGVEISATTSGMGGSSMGIILPEAVLSGARIFIRVGSCGSLIEKSKPGDVIIPTAAIRFDGASNTWAPPEFPAVADYRVVNALVGCAKNRHAPNNFHTGVEVTTDDFYTGQGRPNPLTGEISERMAQRHKEVLRLGAACYSMEAASLFVWCATEGGGLPCGAINAVFANRHTGEFETKGEDLAVAIALDACRLLDADLSMAGYISRRLPVYCRG